jgi:pimeloyl-ACP methyl ester carboxylesterase
MRADAVFSTLWTKAGRTFRPWLTGSRLTVWMGFALVLSPLFAGDLDARALRQARPIGPVYLFRGVFGIDGGITALRDEMLRRGIPAVAYNPGEGGELTQTIASARAANRPTPVILIGYSLGGQNVVDLSYELGQAGIPVDLLVTLDAPDPPPVPPNVRRAVNLYQTVAGAFRGQPLVAAPSFRGQLINTNLNSVPAIEHHDFALRAEVITPVLREVLQTLRRSP